MTGKAADAGLIAQHIRDRLAKSKMDSPAINISREGWALILAKIEGASRPDIKTLVNDLRFGRGLTEGERRDAWLQTRIMQAAETLERLADMNAPTGEADADMSITASIPTIDEVTAAAQALFDRECQRAAARGRTSHHPAETFVVNMPPSYRDDYEADARAMLIAAAKAPRARA